MKFLRTHLLLSVLFISLLFLGSTTANGQSRIKRTVFQGFWWDYWNGNFPNGWANYLTELAPRLKAAGFNAIWIPPVYKNSSTGSVGYSPFDMYDLGDKYQKGGGSLNVRTRVGTKDELLRLIAVMHANGIEVIQDIVLNHNDGAGTNNGAGGQDPHSFSTATSSGYKNFRFSSYATPGIDESQDDYWTRTGRWSKNFPNFHPTGFHNCTSGDICEALFGPDICYFQQAHGQSSNIPTSGSVKIGDTTRHYFNPPQYDHYMRNNGRDWMLWFKKQTGSDGWRWDAVKHYEIDVQKDYTHHTKYSLPDWIKGGQDMFNVAEWVGNREALDNYVNTVKGDDGEKHTGTFDFNLRAYDGSGGLYSMVMGFGGFNMQSLPGAQQNERYTDYGSKRVHRTNPFVNNHDTYRPKLLANGNLYPIGDNTGWNTGDELSAHIDPREPRVAAAYAIVAAVDGNPAVFFEDLFDVATTGKRFTHLPTENADLPVNGDILNILQAHQRLEFKDGEYAVPTHSGNPSYQKGGSGDHLVIERKNRAIIGITDAFSTAPNNNDDQEVWLNVDPSWNGKTLYDYSGAHGTLGTTVQNDSRVLIRTAPVGHTILGAFGHGYSIWAPAPPGVTVTSVQQLFDYLATYEQPLSPVTTQEWEMTDDLGDSHCSSLGQGGALPANSTNQRVAGKIYTDANKTITYKVFPEVDGRNITVSLWDLNGTKLGEVQGVSTAASPVQGTYMANTTGWIIIKVRNTNNAQAGQKVWVNVAYTAPRVVNTRLDAAKPETRAAVWTGNKGTNDVTDCGNWEEGKLPNAAVDVVIPAFSSPAPVINGNLAVRNLVIESGVNLTINNATLTIAGTITNAGTLDATNATIEMNGTIAQNIPANMFVNNTVKSLTINNAAGVSLAGPLMVTDVLTPTSGILNTNGYLTLRSTAANTARVAAGASAGGYITGDVTVERFLSADGNRAYRLLNPVVNTTTSIKTNWQENGNNAAGLGTHITGAGGGANGFDATQTNQPSLFTYDQVSSPQKWVAAGNTTQPLDAKKGYLLYIRGDRTVDLSSTAATLPSTNTVLRATGSLITGQVDFTNQEAAGRFSLITNPYASSINWASVYNDAALTNKDNFYNYYTYWDPNVGTRGGYVTVNTSGTASILTNPQTGTPAATLDIQSGQAFFIRSNPGVTTPPVFTIKEAHKSGVNNVDVFRQGTPEKLGISLFSSLPDGTKKIADGAVVVYNNNFSAAVDGNDAEEIANWDENISIARSGKLLSIEGRPLIDDKDTLFLQVARLKQQTYEWQFLPQSFSQSALQAYLKDNFLGTQQSLNLASGTTIPFNVTNDPASAAADRFMVVFAGGSVLPVNLSVVKAYPKGKDIQVEWTAQAESGIKRYEVEKSTNGQQFSKTATVAAKGTANASYSWLDADVAEGMNYYRITAIGNNGDRAFSKVVNVLMNKGKRLIIYPNPLDGQTLTVAVQLPAGLYTVTLTNKLGQTVYRSKLNHPGGSGVQTLSLGSSLSQGVYQLKVSGGEMNLVQQVIKK